MKRKLVQLVNINLFILTQNVRLKIKIQFRDQLNESILWFLNVI